MPLHIPSRPPSPLASSPLVYPTLTLIPQYFKIAYAKGATWQDIKASQEHLYTAEPPTRDEDGFIVFADTPDFRPNLTPAEVLRRGSFGGGYYRTISSAATGMVHKDAHLEFPAGWFEGIHVGSLVTSNVYRPKTNKYGKKSGQTLEQWEEAGWMESCDPFGWFQVNLCL